MQQGQQDSDSLLLVPGDVERQGQFVDVAEPEDFLELEGNHRKGIGIVALPGVEHTWNPAYIAKGQLVVAILGAAGCKDDGVLRQGLRHLGEILAALVAAIAACHDDKTLDGTAFDGIHDLVRKGQDLVVGETANDVPRLDLDRRLAGLRHFDDRREILGLAVLPVGDMDRARVSRHARGEKPSEIGVVLFQGNEAVRGHQDRPVEGLELLVLLPPGVPIVPDEMAVLLERRVVIGRQHFAVRVDIHAGSLRLLEEFFHVAEVMAADQDARIAANADVHFRDFGVAVRGCVGLVQESHGFDSLFPGFHNHSDHLVDRQVLRRRRQRLHEEVVNGFVLIAEHRGMIGVSRDTLQADDEQFTKGTDILVLRCQHPDGAGLLVEFRLVRRHPGGGIGHRFTKCLAGLCLVCGEDTPSDRLAASQGLADKTDETLIIPVCVGDSGKESLGDEKPVRLVGNTQFNRLLRPDGNSLKRVNQQVLQVCRDLRLAADPLYRASLVLRTFLALETEHSIFPLQSVI